MARVTLSAGIQAVSGAAGSVVFKQYGDKTVLSKYPDMSRVKPSAAQKLQRERMRCLRFFYAEIEQQPAVRKKWTAEAEASGLTLYRFVTREYMRRAKETGKTRLSLADCPSFPSPAARHGPR